MSNNSVNAPLVPEPSSLDITVMSFDKSNEEIRLDSDLLLGRATRVDYANSNLLGYSGASNLFINDEQQAVNGKLLDPAVLFKDNAWLLELL